MEKVSYKMDDLELVFNSSNISFNDLEVGQVIMYGYINAHYRIVEIEYDYIVVTALKLTNNILYDLYGGVQFNIPVESIFSSLKSHGGRLYTLKSVIRTKKLENLML